MVKIRQNNIFYVIISRRKHEKKLKKSNIFQDVGILLSQIGLKDKEAKIFMACLTSREGLYVHEIVEKSKLKRSTVDLVLKRLLAGSYITKIKIEARYKYFAEAPETILFRQERVVEELRDVLPLLAKMNIADGQETEIRFFEGTEGIKRVYEDIHLALKILPPDKRELLSFSSGLDVIKIFPDIQKSFIEKRVKLGAWYKAISPQNSESVQEWMNDTKSLRQIKYIDEHKFPFRVTFEIYSNSVMIYAPTKPIGGVIIKNAKIASSMRSLFYLVWEMLD